MQQLFSSYILHGIIKNIPNNVSLLTVPEDILVSIVKYVLSSGLFLYMV